MKNKLKNNRIAIRLNEKEYQHLTEIAEQNNITLSKAVRYAITATYLSSISHDKEKKKQETDFIIDGIFKRMDYQEDKIEYLERILYSQKTDIDKHIKVIEKMDKERIEVLTNQMTINNVSE